MRDEVKRALLLRKATVWNLNYPAGTDVLYRDDSGQYHHATTDTEAFIMSETVWVFLQGRSRMVQLLELVPVEDCAPALMEKAVAN